MYELVNCVQIHILYLICSSWKSRDQIECTHAQGNVWIRLMFLFNGIMNVSEITGLVLLPQLYICSLNHEYDAYTELHVYM